MTAREYAQTLELLELHGIAHRVVGPAARRRGRARQGARDGRAPACAPPLREGAPLRPRARARLARGDARRAQPRDPRRDRARLRVRDAAAPARASAPRRASSSRTPSRPTGSPGSAPEAAEARPVPGDRGGVLPRRLRARPGRRSTASTRRSVLAVVRTPPDVSLYHRHGNPLFAACSSGSAATSPSTRSCCPRTAEQRDAIRGARPPLAARPGACGRRPEPRRTRRSRRLGRRDDEPRGRRARHARLHDIRRPARRRRRGVDPRRAAACRSPTPGRSSLRKRDPRRSRGTRRDPRLLLDLLLLRGARPGNVRAGPSGRLSSFRATAS